MQAEPATTRRHQPSLTILRVETDTADGKKALIPYPTSTHTVPYPRGVRLHEGISEAVRRALSTSFASTRICQPAPSRPKSRSFPRPCGASLRPRSTPRRSSPAPCRPFPQCPSEHRFSSGPSRPPSALPKAPNVRPARSHSSLYPHDPLEPRGHACRHVHSATLGQPPHKAASATAARAGRATQTRAARTTGTPLRLSARTRAPNDHRSCMRITIQHDLSPAAAYGLTYSGLQR